MKNKVFWKEEEREALVAAIAYFKEVTPAISLLQALDHVQEQVLPEHRRRIINTEALVPWLRQAVDTEMEKRKANKEHEEENRQHVLAAAIASATVPQLLDAIMDKLDLREYAAGFLDDLLIRSSVVKRLEAEFSRFKEPSEIAISSARHQERTKPKVVILGLKNAQQKEIETEFRAAFNFKFLTSDQYAHNRGLVADHVIGMIDFLPHPTDISAKKHFTDRYHRVHGVMSNLRATLLALLQ